MSEPNKTLSPQRRAKCACPSWTSARQCYCLRYAPDDTEPKDEVCECVCHDEDDDEWCYGDFEEDE
jgi:hypothetical protein